MHIPLKLIVFYAIGLSIWTTGCASSRISSGPEILSNGLIKAKSSKYRVLVIEFGSDGVGSLAKENGIEYIVRAETDTKSFFHFFKRRQIVIYGASDLVSLNDWKEDQIAKIVESAINESIAQARDMAPDDESTQQLLAIALAKEKLFMKQKSALANKSL